MAASRVRSRASGMVLGVDVDLERTSREFKEVRRRVATDLALVEQAAAEATVLPAAKASASRFKVDGESIGTRVIVRKSAKGPYLTTNMRGIRARAASLLEFGGKVKTPIMPKHKARSGRPGALLVNGSPRATVRSVRHYRARRYLRDAVDERLEAFGEHVRDAIVDFFTET
jgi:hypothetical protein